MRYFWIFCLVTFFSTPLFAEPTVLMAQKKLKALGLYQGPLDGFLGSKTNAAIRRYQIRKDLIITGELTEETLRSLKIIQPPASK